MNTGPVELAADKTSRGQFANGANDAREELIKLLLDHHGTGRILFRNSRQTVQGFPDREKYGYLLQGDEYSDLQNSPYLEWLIEKLKALGDEKVLLICKRAETVMLLEQVIAAACRTYCRRVSRRHDYRGAGSRRRFFCGRG